jgi:hypothetical protein
MMAARERKPKREACLGGHWGMKSASRALWVFLSVLLTILSIQ